ncbi:Thymidylate kinase [Pirellula sp. SH-Sr6A]|uniref:dTMP kinase n=1 Tax=Pirellula sp. SH-Sr6A TaxID=1632865 RepID=UPI00078B96E0|nr:dTMP kinase [Pirellula sp. SH-Sr6A]AMV30767.1 Thymidylate kinase [Pirellula sp. SH-Sr6A]
MPSQDGILIAIEGIDGTGKTTQAKLLADLLSGAGEVVKLSKEPTDGQWGRKLRASAQAGRLPLKEELELFVKDRKEHVETLIQPALDRGGIVILDRYFYSTIAYQGARGANPGDIEAMMQFAPVPDVVFLLDADPRITIGRISEGRNETPNEFEGLENLQACRSVFLDLAKTRDEIHSIDATLPIDFVSMSVCKALLDTVLYAKRCRKVNGCDVFDCGFRALNECRWAILKSKLSPAQLRASFSKA